MLTLRPHIDQLPVELLIEIFIQACEEYKHNVRMEIYNNTKGGFSVLCPGKLSLVCRAWKDIAYATTELWDTLLANLWFPPRNCQNHARYVNPTMKLKLWLGRSGNRPLTVKITEYLHPDHGNFRGSLMIRELLAHRHRWKVIDIMYPSNDAQLSTELNNLRGNLPAHVLALLLRPSKPPESYRTISHRTPYSYSRPPGIPYIHPPQSNNLPTQPNTSNFHTHIGAPYNPGPIPLQTLPSSPVNPHNAFMHFPTFNPPSYMAPSHPGSFQHPSYYSPYRISAQPYLPSSSGPQPYIPNTFQPPNYPHPPQPTYYYGPNSQFNPYNGHLQPQTLN